MLSEVRHTYLQLMPHATMLYFCVICKTQGSVLQTIIIIINHLRNVHKARHVAEIHVKYGQCAGASFDSAYQIRLN